MLFAILLHIVMAPRAKVTHIRARQCERVREVTPCREMDSYVFSVEARIPRRQEQNLVMFLNEVLQI